MEPTLQRVVDTLNSITETAIIWPEGLFHTGGPHRRLKHSLYPISIGEDECAVFGKLVETFEPKHCFIIGNAFGLSSAYIAAKMKEHGGQSVVSLDSQSEGDGARCAEIAQKLRNALELDLLQNKKGWSPQDIPTAADQGVYDLIFIDGLHRHPHVIKDFDGMAPYADDNSLVVWHDYWIRGVPESVEHATKQGFRCLWIPTSCEMVVGVKSAERFERLRGAFPEGREQFSHPNYLVGYLRHLQTVAAYHVGRAFGR